MLETACQLVDQCGTIVGFYFVNAHIEDRRVPVVAEKMAMLLESKCPGCILIQVINENLRDPADHALQAWGKSSNGTYNTGLRVSPLGSPDDTFHACLSLASSAVAKGLHLSYFDFDDHFEDVSHNPMNPNVDAELHLLESNN